MGRNEGEGHPPASSGEACAPTCPPCRTLGFSCSCFHPSLQLSPRESRPQSLHCLPSRGSFSCACEYALMLPYFWKKEKSFMETSWLPKLSHTLGLNFLCLLPLLLQLETQVLFKLLGLDDTPFSKATS